MFGNLGFGELMIIMVIVLVLFGAKRVPEISASFGKGIREFKRNLNDVEQSVMNPTAVNDQPRTAWTPLPPAEPARDETVADDREREREPRRLL